MNKQEIEHFIDTIIVDCFPEEEPVYSLEKTDLFAQAWRRDFSKNDPYGLGINQAGNATEIILSCISTVLGTIKTIVELYQVMAKSSPQDSFYQLNKGFMAKKWSAELQLAGMDAFTAEALTKRFSEDFELLLKND